MKKRNAGVTIVELIVVMAILAIATGITLANVGSLTGYRARECAKKISSELSANKVTTLGKATNNGDITFEITKEGNKVYFTTHTIKNGNPTPVDEKKLMGKGRMIVEYVDATGTHEIGSSDAHGNAIKLALYYNRSTGQICKVGESDKCDVTNVIISNSGRTKTYDIKVYPLTGKIKATW